MKVAALFVATGGVYFGLPGVEIPAGDGVGHVCCVAQGHYGHRARKLTWLYTVGMPILPDLDWSIPAPRSRLDYGFHSAEERAERRSAVAPVVNATRLTARENLATPIPFRDLLLGMARACNWRTS